MKAFIFTLLHLLIGTCAFAGAPHSLSIYRNDGKFNQIRLCEGQTLSHSTLNGMPVLNASDWINGETAVPLAAIDSCVTTPGDIPVIHLHLNDYPEADALWDKELYLDATLDVEGNGYADDASGLELRIKGRGNTTWYMPKKPMRLKFSKKVSLCGLKKAKNYVLLNNYLDPTLMRNAIAMWLARRLGVPYANSMVPCHVFINEHYAGAYTLTEKVGINSTSVDIDENEGVLMELSMEFDEPYKFKSSLWQLPVMIKDPDFDELYESDPSTLTPDERLRLWEEDFNRAEQLVSQGRGAEAFDIESAVNYYFLYEIVKNSELSYPKSMYIHKRSLAEGEKYYFGPAWDFDVAFNFQTPAEDGYELEKPQGNIYVTVLLTRLKNTPEFQNLYKQRISELRDEIYPELMEFFDRYAALIEPSAKLNGMRWPYEGPHAEWTYTIPSFDTKLHTGRLREWLRARITYLTNRP